MTEPRQLAIVRSWDELHAALRARADELRWSRLALDEIAGLADGHVAKLLAPVPIKGMGAKTFGPVLGAMGLLILVCEDPVALAAARRFAAAKGLTERDEKLARQANMPATAMPATGGVRNPALRDPALASEFGRRMRSRQLAKMSPAQRRKSARHAARARWAKVRMAKGRRKKGTES